MANTYLQKSAFGSANQKTYTISFWAKLSQSTTGNVLAFVQSGNYVRLFFENGALKLKSVINSSTVFELKTNRLFRDFSAWYNFVIAMDTTQATASNRIKFYINGVLETPLATATYPSQNFDTDSNNDLKIGYNGTDNYFDGLLSHFHYIDGTAYDASAFGSTDSVTGEWSINTSPSVTYGSGGFLILKDGNTITDQSSNSNDFSLGGGTLTNTLDNPSNNFCTMSPIMQPKNSSMDVFKYGNLFCGGSSSVSDYSACGSIGVNTGKWYWEIKIEDADNTRNLGIVRADKINISTTFGFYVGSAGNSTTTAFTAGLRGSDGVFINKAGGSQTNTDISTTFTTGDIMAIALDLTSSTKTIQFYKNGSASGSAQTLDNAFVDDFVLPACRLDGGQTVTFNFGNGYFGTTAITTNSGNGYAGAEGKSKFNYQPPTGHSALTTKGLNE